MYACDSQAHFSLNRMSILKQIYVMVNLMAKKVLP